ncbi:MAG TPA: SAM-dependent chlorinase/fluorinase [Kouleothrix sp.]|uniref:SAM hydrolase/SAM-dependent halogenase family protein n=1 Tax=Kouleothrix sp. TaxID=2779161 RepID=UPI002C042F40|nr:SAM-dependent chlorinase/fluorinase [Kouleothrix sp.]HRC75518.1 SAM-dependent chlorinase/fluorinase [Kouleothrix sp.]
MQPNGIITLTTDFGATDSYVGSMKGVILSIAPQARLIDITHEIGPQDTHQAAYVVQTFYSYFPPGTIHLVIVDPGVGSTRRAIALGTPEAIFVAPDNGVLTYVWRDALDRFGAGACQVHELAEPRFWLANISNTFHGRDLFAPTVAHLAGGVPIQALGPRLAGLTEADLEQPSQSRNGGLAGRIIHVDHFGNCITNITPAHLEQAGLSERLVVRIIDQRIAGLGRTFADAPVGALIALIGSNNRLELAVRNGSAAQTLGVGIGDTVRVDPAAS